MPHHAAPPAGAGGGLSAARARRAGGPAAARFGDLLPGVLARLGLAEDFARWRAVEEWEAVVGPSLARHTRVVRVERDVLVVEADSPATMHHVSHYRRELLERLTQHVGAGRFADVRFVLARTAG